SIQETEMLMARQWTRQRSSPLLENNDCAARYHFTIKLCALIYPTFHPANSQSHFFNGVTSEDQQKVRFVIFAANQPFSLGADSFGRVVQTSRAPRQSCLECFIPELTILIVQLLQPLEGKGDVHPCGQNRT